MHLFQLFYSYFLIIFPFLTMHVVFKYKQGLESVLVVSKDDYYSCNTNNPITALTNGDSVFRLDRSGPFYFIAGSFDKCQKGQKLHLVVLAVRTPKGHHNTTSPSPSPSSDAAQSPRADPPVPQQRVDPSSLEDAPSPSPAGHRSAAAAIGFGGTVFGIFSVIAHVVLVTFVGNVV